MNAKEAILFSDWANGRLPGPMPKSPKQADPEPQKLVVARQELESPPATKKDIEEALKKSSESSQAYWGTVVVIAALAFFGHPGLAAFVLVCGAIGSKLR